MTHLLKCKPRPNMEVCPYNITHVFPRGTEHVCEGGRVFIEAMKRTRISPGATHPGNKLDSTSDRIDHLGPSPSNPITANPTEMMPRVTPTSNNYHVVRCPLGREFEVCRYSMCNLHPRGSHVYPRKTTHFCEGKGFPSNNPLILRCPEGKEFETCLYSACNMNPRGSHVYLRGTYHVCEGSERVIAKM